MVGDEFFSGYTKDKLRELMEKHSSTEESIEDQVTGNLGLGTEKSVISQNIYTHNGSKIGYRGKL